MEDIITLIDKKGRYSKAEKERITAYLNANGVQVPDNAACNNCWRDALILATLEDKKSNTDADGANVGIRLKGDAANIGVYWQGRYVSQAVMTEELAEWLLSTNFPKELYDEDR